MPSGNGAHEPLLATSQPVFAHKAAVESSQTSVAAGSSGVKSGSVSRTGSPSPFNAAATRVPNNGILITVNEKVSAQLSRDGSISSSEVKGDLQLRINQTELANAKILLKSLVIKTIQNPS